MTIGTPIQFGSNTSSVTGTTIATTAASVPAGSLIFLAFVVPSSASAVTSVTDSAGNVYTVNATSQGWTSVRVQIAWCANCPALSSGTITATLGASVANKAVSAWYVPGISGVDVTGVGSGSGSATTLTEATGALAQANELVFGAFATDPVSTAPAASGFTLGSTVNTSAMSLNSGYKIVSSAASTSFAPSWTTTGQCGAIVASFKGVPDTYDPRVRLAYLDF